MSSASAAPAAHAHEAHEAHAFDGEPVDTLPDDEPRTPGWLTVTGLGLFVLVAIVALAGGSGDPAAATKAPAMVAQAAQVQVAPRAAPAPAPLGTTRRLTMDDFKQPGQPNARPGALQRPIPLPPGLPTHPRAQPAH